MRRPWERGRLARMDNRGPAAHCGRDARAPRKPVCGFVHASSVRGAASPVRIRISPARNRSRDSRIEQPHRATNVDPHRTTEASPPSRLRTGSIPPPAEGAADRSSRARRGPRPARGPPARPRPPHRAPAPDPGHLALHLRAPSRRARPRDAAADGGGLRGRDVLRALRRARRGRGAAAGDHGAGLRQPSRASWRAPVPCSNCCPPPSARMFGWFGRRAWAGATPLRWPRSATATSIT